MIDFSQWACAVSTATNRSLAGATIALKGGDSASRAAARSALQQWGMIEVEESPDFVCDLEVSTEQDSGKPAISHDFLMASTQSDFNLRQSDGAHSIAHARQQMPVTRALVSDLASSGALKGLSLGVCLVLEPKTAVFLEELAQAGARVGIYSDAESSDPRVIEELRAQGILVGIGDSGDGGQRREVALGMLDALKPDLIIDDGASFARLALMERAELASKLIGVAEETTSGVRAFDAMEREGDLAFPVVAVNDSVLKTGFDNAHGTGETCVTTLQDLLGADVFAGKSVAVVGYGPVGQGFVRRIRALGASVTICDIDPVACLRAIFDGFPTADSSEIFPRADMVISATGVRHTVTLSDLQSLKSGAVVGVIGGIANEIALDDLPGFTYDPTAAVRDITLSGGKHITLVSDGDGVNYTSGNGNPIDIMDLSFAVQTEALRYLLNNRGKLPSAVHRLRHDSDAHIASVAVRQRGFGMRSPEDSSSYDWRLTRFEDEAAHRHGIVRNAPEQPGNQMSTDSEERA